MDDDGSVRVEWDASADALALAADSIAVVATDLTGTPVAVSDGHIRADGTATLGIPYADRGRYAFHVIVYRLGADDDQDDRDVVLRAGFHGSLRFEEGLDGMAGNAVIVTGQAKRSAMLGDQDNREVILANKPQGLLGAGLSGGVVGLRSAAGGVCEAPVEDEPSAELRPPPLKDDPDVLSDG